MHGFPDMVNLSRGDSFLAILCYPMFQSKLILFDFWHPGHLSKLWRKQALPFTQGGLSTLQKEVKGIYFEGTLEPI